MTASDLIRRQFKTEMEKTRPLLARVPDDKMDYQPHPHSMKMGRLAGHIAELPRWLREVVSSDTFEFFPGGKAALTAFAATSNAELLARFDFEVAAAGAALEKLEDAQLDRTWSATRHGVPVVTGPRWEMIERNNIGHMVHHRAQLGVYLRLNDIPVPGVFGPSHDDNAAAPKPAP